MQVSALDLVRGWKWTLVAGVVLGVGLMLAVFTETVYSIVFLTDYGGRFFCDVVA